MHLGQASPEVSRALERPKITQKTDSGNALISLLQGVFKFHPYCSQFPSFELVELLLDTFFSQTFPLKIQHDRK